MPHLIPLQHHFNLAATIQSGQTFHWHEYQQGWLGTIGEAPVYIVQTTLGLHVTPPEMAQLVISYFALDHDFTAILATFPADDAPLAQAPCGETSVSPCQHYLPMLPCSTPTLRQPR
jgi:hypothetical protein